MGALEDGLERIEGKGARLVAVSADHRDDLDALAKKMGLTFPLVADPSLRIAEAYGVRQAGKDIALPATFVLDADHRVVFRRVGGNLVDRPSVEEIAAAVP